MRFFRNIITMSLFLAALGGGFYWAFRFEIHYYRNREQIEDAAQRYQVPPHLIAAVIWQETRFNAACRGKAGEIGLMQIMPQSAGEWVSKEHITGFEPRALLDPGTNILAGTWYLGRAIRRWNTHSNPIPYALAEYNAGRSNALRWDRDSIRSPALFIELIDYPSTRVYVRNIMSHYQGFGRPWERW